MWEERSWEARKRKQRINKVKSPLQWKNFLKRKGMIKERKYEPPFAFSIES